MFTVGARIPTPQIRTPFEILTFYCSDLGWFCFWMFRTIATDNLPIAMVPTVRNLNKQNGLFCSVLEWSGPSKTKLLASLDQKFKEKLYVYSKGSWLVTMLSSVFEWSGPFKNQTKWMPSRFRPIEIWTHWTIQNLNKLGIWTPTVLEHHKYSILDCSVL